MKAKFVYLIGNPVLKYYKIGRSCRPTLRLVQLDTPKLPFPIIPIYTVEAGKWAGRLEKALQEVFSPYHARGEWFEDIPTRKFPGIAKTFLKIYRQEKETREAQVS